MNITPIAPLAEYLLMAEQEDLPNEIEPVDKYASDLEAIGRDPNLWLYRERTLGLLKRYFRLSIEVGRLPSLLGREFFRSRVTSYRMSTFEDAVIFVHDVERSLEQLDDFERELIAKIVLQEYTHDEAARLMGCWRRTVGRRFTETLDHLSEIFLEGELLVKLPETPKKKAPQSCQEGEIDEKLVNHS